jgi:hypothetical protein
MNAPELQFTPALARALCLRASVRHEWVYIFGPAEWPDGSRQICKVGLTADPNKRLEDHRRANPASTYLILILVSGYGRRAEGNLHEFFRQQGLHVEKENYLLAQKDIDQFESLTELDWTILLCIPQKHP